MQAFIRLKMVLLLYLGAVLLVSACSSEQKSGRSSLEQSQSPQTGETIELTISAAASLTDALKEVGKAYELNHQAVKLNFNFGGSGALQQQIEQGAPADLFLSASTTNIKTLIDKQLIDANQQKTLLTNELVAVIPKDGKASIGGVTELTTAEVKNIAIGIPESVPAGSYTKQALTSVKLWDALQAKMVQAKDVRQVLQYVETGNADVGFVYKTDALTSQKIKIAFAVDPQTYAPVQYPVGIVKASKHSKEAADFYAFLQTKEALDLFVKYGFSIPK